MADIVAAQSGDWNNTATWTGGVIPTTGDNAFLGNFVIDVYDGDTLDADKIYQGTTVGSLGTGRIELQGQGVADAINTYTINADLYPQASSTSMMVTPDAATFSGETANLIINGDVITHKISSNAQTVIDFYNKSGIDHANITVNGDVQDSYGNNGETIYMGGGDADSSTLTVNGNLLVTNTSYYGSCVRIINATNISVDINGYVEQQPSYSSSTATLYISPTTGTHNIEIDGITPSAADPGAEGQAVKIQGTTGLDGHVTINSVGGGAGGTAIEPAGGHGLYMDVNTWSSITINGDVVSADTNSRYSFRSDNDLSIPVTINGNILPASAPDCGYAVYMSGITSTLIVNGDVDARTLQQSSTADNVGLIYLHMSANGKTMDVTINGDVYGVDNNINTSLDAQSAILVRTAGGNSIANLTVTGTVYAGKWMPAIMTHEAETRLDYGKIGSVSIGSVVGNNYPDAGVHYPNAALHGIEADDGSIGNLIFGANGVAPLSGCSGFKITDSITVLDSNENLTTVSISDGGSMPAQTDVRDGVSYGNGLTGSLDLPLEANVMSGIQFDNATKTGALAVATQASVDTVNSNIASVSNAVSANQSLLTQIDAQTNQLSFTGGGVVADASGSASDYTSRFDALDTATSGIKAKTDQLTFTVSGVQADAGAVDYTTRFNTLDGAIAAIPTINYSARFDAIDADLDAISTGGGVNFTPVLNAISATDAKVDTANTGITAVNAKTSQLEFTADGVVSDASISVSQAINYDARFDAIDTDTAAIKAKTDQLTFDGSLVESSAIVDLTNLNPLFAQVNTNIGNVNGNLADHDTEIKAQLTTIQNATGAIDLTPILTNQASLASQIALIPTTTYTTRFNSVDATLTSIQTGVSDIGNNPDLQGIKAQTDKLAFIGDAVKAVSSGDAPAPIEPDESDVTVTAPDFASVSLQDADDNVFITTTGNDGVATFRIPRQAGITYTVWLTSDHNPSKQTFVSQSAETYDSGVTLEING